MLSRTGLVLATLLVGGCVSDSRQEAVTFTMPPVASAAAEPADTADPLGLQRAIALVRQQPWCYRRSFSSR